MAHYTNAYASFLILIILSCACDTQCVLHPHTLVHIHCVCVCVLGSLRFYYFAAFLPTLAALDLFV